MMFLNVETQMKRFAILLVVLALTASSLACRALLPGSAQGQYDSVCRDSVAGMNALTANLKIPEYFQQENPVKQGGEFDPNRYFEVLTHLKMQDGFILDYVYSYQGIGGQPLLYARRVDEKPFQTETDFRAAQPASFLSAVEADDTPEGYLQISLLALMGSQFYLFWHAGYNDSQILCGSSDIERIISENAQSGFGMKMNEAQKLKARAISRPGPAVEIKADHVTVSMVLFTNWGGFIRRTYTINRASPHTILDVQNETLVEYNCGVMF
jgi:hypothetical protein